LRVRLPDGSYPYLKPAYASNGRLRPHVAIRNGKATHFPDGTYYLRHQLGSKRIWEPAGDDPSLALVNLQKKVHALQGAALQLAEPVIAPPPPPPPPPPAPVAKAEADPSKRLLADCAAKYIEETTEHKSIKTLAAYRLTVTAFSSLVKKQHIEDINREDLLSYIAALRKKGSSPRTIRNRIDHLQIFFHRFKIPSLLTGNDLPKYTEKKVRSYNPLELGKMFGDATADESDLLHFLLCTGAREQEAQYVCWSDVDLERKTYTVTEHLDLGYRPKDKEEGTLPIPDPVCRHILLHKMRKTFASTLHHKGLPAQTLQRYLRHSDLSTTLAYIADQPDDQVRETINSTFSGFGGSAA
jgi:integrase/recombinase XerD